MVVYDVTDQESFNNVYKWIQELQRYSPENTKKMIVGAKRDLFHQRTVEYEKVSKYCEEHAFPHIETSSKKNTNVEAAFLMLSLELLINEDPNLKEFLEEHKNIFEEYSLENFSNFPKFFKNYVVTILICLRKKKKKIPKFVFFIILEYLLDKKFLFNLAEKSYLEFEERKKNPKKIEKKENCKIN